MIVSRDLADLLPEVEAKAREFLKRCEGLGHTLLVTCTYRDNEAQDNLYASGRTRPGPILTMARGGKSLHNQRRAIDIVPLVSGKPLWNTTERVASDTWLIIGSIGQQCGLEWGGAWSGKFKEFAHFQG